MPQNYSRLSVCASFFHCLSEMWSEDINNLPPISKNSECIGDAGDFFPCVALLEAAIESCERLRYGRWRERKKERDRERERKRQREIREVSALLSRACWVHKGKEIGRAVNNQQFPNQRMKLIRVKWILWLRGAATRRRSSCSRPHTAEKYIYLGEFMILEWNKYEYLPMESYFFTFLQWHQVHQTLLKGKFTILNIGRLLCIYIWIYRLECSLFIF